MRFAFLFTALAWGQEATAPQPTVEQLQKQLDAANARIAVLEADTAWLDKDRLIAYAIYQMCMGQRPTETGPMRLNVPRQQPQIAPAKKPAQGAQPQP